MVVVNGDLEQAQVSDKIYYNIFSATHKATTLLDTTQFVIDSYQELFYWAGFTEDPCWFECRVSVVGILIQQEFLDMVTYSFDTIR